MISGASEEQLELANVIADKLLLQKENQELKKLLEEINKMIEKCGFVNIEQVMLNYCGLLSQQKEFIKYLEDEIKSSSALDTINKQTAMYIYSTTLKKCKEIIGDKQ